MGKKGKRVAIESKTNNPENSLTETETETNLSLLNGDSHKKKKMIKNKADKETNSEAKADEIPTISIAIAGSIIDNAQSLELATRLAGQIARAATIFRIDEVVVFDNKRSSGNNAAFSTPNYSNENERGAPFLVRILEYLETPQYLRKALFPKHNSLRYVGMLPPLDAPHHLRKHEWAPYREGVTLKERDTSSMRTVVDVGLDKNVVVDQTHEPGVRVTVAMGTNQNLDSDLPRHVVLSSKPREEGTYWGYKVRYASNISSVLTDCPYKGGYDHLIGTSEHGLIVNSSEINLPAFRHLLIAFGGLSGLEKSVGEDHKLKGKNVRDFFDLYLNTCPNQGSRTIRTEEALLISLQYFQEPISRALQSAVS